MSFSIAGSGSQACYSSNSDEEHEEITTHAFLTSDEMIVLRGSCYAHVYSARSFELVGRVEPELKFQGDEMLISLIPNSSVGVIGWSKQGFQLFDFVDSGPISPFVSIGLPICAVRATKQRVIVLTRTKLLIFILKSLELILCMDRDDDVPEDSMNVLSVSAGGLVAFVKSAGVVQLVDSVTLFHNEPLNAHSSAITALDLSDDVLITGSRKGTIIRVFSIPSLSLLSTFRRGRTESTIRSIRTSNMTPTGLFVTVTGDSDTVHIFHIPPVSPDSSSSPVTMMGSVLKLLPFNYRDAVEPGRAFCFIRLRREGDARYVGLVLESGKAVVVSESTGFAFVYDTSKPGECRLLSEHALLSEPIPVIGGSIDSEHSASKLNSTSDHSAKSLKSASSEAIPISGPERDPPEFEELSASRRTGNKQIITSEAG